MLQHGSLDLSDPIAPSSIATAEHGLGRRMEFVARDERVGDLSNESLFAHAMKR
jgi:hypothetical protein